MYIVRKWNFTFFLLLLLKCCVDGARDYKFVIRRWGCEVYSTRQRVHSPETLLKSEEKQNDGVNLEDSNNDTKGIVYKFN